MKVTANGFIYYRHYEWEEKPTFGYNNAKLEGNGFICVRPHTIEFEVADDFNPIPDLVASLEAKAKELKAKFSKEMMEIEDSISKLTCITMEPA